MSTEEQKNEEVNADSPVKGPGSAMSNSKLDIDPNELRFEIEEVDARKTSCNAYRT